MPIKPVVDFIGDVLFVKRTITNPHIIEEYKEYLDEDNSYECASIYAMNHPVWGQDTVRTSIVIKKNPDGSFETMNTIYQPVKEEEDV